MHEPQATNKKTHHAIWTHMFTHAVATICVFRIFICQASKQLTPNTYVVHVRSHRVSFTRVPPQISIIEIHVLPSLGIVPFVRFLLRQILNVIWLLLNVCKQAHKLTNMGHGPHPLLQPGVHNVCTKNKMHDTSQ